MITTTRRHLVLAATAVAVVTAGWVVSARQTSTSDRALSSLVLPSGFHVSVYANNVQNAREMALGAKGTVFVGSRLNDKVFALVDRDGNHVADQVKVIASGLNARNGVAFKDGALRPAAHDGGNPPHEA